MTEQQAVLSVEERLCAVAIEAIVARLGAGWQVRAVRVLAVDGMGGKAVLPLDLARPLTPLTLLPSVRQRVLSYLGLVAKPVKGAALALRAGTRNNGHFRVLMSELQTEGLVTRSRAAGGYWLASRHWDDAA